MWVRGLGLSLAAMVALGQACAWADAGGFDGNWDVIAVCPSTGTAMGYTLQFPAQVTGGVLHGVYGTLGQASSMALDGTIQTDGTAKFVALGLTGDSTFSALNAKPGTPYRYEVAATFKGSRGTGTRTDGTRVCNFSFTRR
jgi:hypothetical protein